MNKFLIILIICSSVLVTQEKQNTKKEKNAVGSVLLHKDKKEIKDGEMKQYFLVLLKRGPIRNQDSITSEAIQKGHLDNITRLYNEGKIDLAGPMGNDGELRGIFVFDCETYEEVQQLCSTDPAIKSGRLVVEIYPWWAGKGSKLR